MWYIKDFILLYTVPCYQVTFTFKYICTRFTFHSSPETLLSPPPSSSTSPIISVSWNLSPFLTSFRSHANWHNMQNASNLTIQKWNVKYNNTQNEKSNIAQQYTNDKTEFQNAMKNKNSITETVQHLVNEVNICYTENLLARVLKIFYQPMKI